MDLEVRRVGLERGGGVCGGGGGGVCPLGVSRPLWGGSWPRPWRGLWRGGGRGVEGCGGLWRAVEGCAGLGAGLFPVLRQGESLLAPAVSSSVTGGRGDGDSS